MWYSALGCIVTCILSLLAGPRATEVQMPPHVYRLGVLSATAPTPAALRRHREAVPHLSRLAVLWNQSQPAHTPFLKTLEPVAGAVGIALHPVAVHRPEDFEGAFAAMRAARAEALMLTGSGLLYHHLRQIADLARTSGLPAMTWERAFAEGGLFMTYRPDEGAIFRRAAHYVDRILKGTKPADLPVERPIKFELVINLKTAKALGFTISPSLLFQADEVLQ